MATMTKAPEMPMNLKQIKMFYRSEPTANFIEIKGVGYVCFEYNGFEFLHCWTIDLMDLEETEHVAINPETKEIRTLN